SSASFFQRSCHPPALPSFPTRRSSDLFSAFNGSTRIALRAGMNEASIPTPARRIATRARVKGSLGLTSTSRLEIPRVAAKVITRSEEHTSELQSLTNLVCRLLLEKKKI